MTSQLIAFNHLRCHSSSTALGTRTGYWKPTRRGTDETPNHSFVTFSKQTEKNVFNPGTFGVRKVAILWFYSVFPNITQQLLFQSDSRLEPESNESVNCIEKLGPRWTQRRTNLC